MYAKRDRFLTEAMGECWHELHSTEDVCCKCGEDLVVTMLGIVCDEEMNNFSTWEGFGKLWNWVQKQEWFDTYKMGMASNRAEVRQYFIKPDCFADAVYKYLKEK